MFKNIFSFKGRIRRLEFDITILVFYIIGFFLIIEYGDFINNTILGNILISIYQFIQLYIFFAQASKRSHDLGNSSWYLFSPFYYLWLIFQKGEDKDNKYGKNPKSNSNEKIL